VRLRGDFNKMLATIAQIQEEQRRLRESYEGLEKRVGSLEGGVAGLEKLVGSLQDGVAGLEKRVGSLEGGVAKLEERVGSLEGGVVRLEKRVGSLEGGVAKLEKRVESVEGGVAKLEKRVESLEGGVVRLEKRMGSLEVGLRGLEGGMLKGFADLSRFAGVNFEDFVRSFLTEVLRRSGEIPEGAEIRKAVVDGEEINIFLEDPLIVGEVTAYADSADEIIKLLRKAELVKSKYSREPRKIMIALNVKGGVVGEIEKIAEERGVELVIGKAVE